MLALDAVGHPDPQAVKDSGALFIARYVPSAYQHYGITRDQLNAYRDAGVSVLPIFEEWESQFLGGRQGAVAHIGRMLKGCETLGITPGDDFIPAVATVDPRPGDVNGHEGLLQEYAAGIDDTLGLPEWTGYGSAYGFKVIADGGAAAHMTRRWGVGTWGFGEKPDGSLPDPLPAPADMIQHGNLGYVNVGGVDCDPNTVFRSDMGQWPRTPVPGPIPTPADDEECLMQTFIHKTTGVPANDRFLLVDSNRDVVRFDDVDRWNAAYGTIGPNSRCSLTLTPDELAKYASQFPPVKRAVLLG